MMLQRSTSCPAHLRSNISSSVPRSAEGGEQGWGKPVINQQISVKTCFSREGSETVQSLQGDEALKLLRYAQKEA